MFNPKNIFLYSIGLLFVLALIWWNLSGPSIDLYTSEPGMDNRGSEAGGISEVINIGAFFELFTDTDSELNDTWPRFRGTEFDNIKKSGSALLEKFNNDPKIQWSVELGEGHAGPSVYKGKVYLLDYDEEIRADMLKCFSLKDGKELWRRWYNVNIKRNHGMSRTIPALTEEYILTIGPRSHVMCLDRKTGDLSWGMDVEKLNTLYYKGIEYFTSEEFDKAIKVWEKCLKINPNFDRAKQKIKEAEKLKSLQLEETKELREKYNESLKKGR